MSAELRWLLLGVLLAFTWSNLMDGDWLGAAITGAGTLAALWSVGAFARSSGHDESPTQPSEED